MIKSPVSKKRKIEILEKEQVKFSNDEQEKEEVQFSTPLISLEELKKVNQEKKHREEMKSFLLSKGFNPKRFGRTSTQTIEAHIEEFQFRESKNDKDSEFVQDYEKAPRNSKQTQQQQNHQDHSQQQHKPEQQQPQQESQQSAHHYQQQQSTLDEELQFAADIEKANYISSSTTASTTKRTYKSG